MSVHHQDRTITINDVRSLELLRQKIAAGVDVNHPATELYSPLGLAAREANLDACRLLLDAGADPDVCGTKGASPLSELLGKQKEDGASRAAITEVVKLLLEYGANPDGNMPAEVAPIGYNLPIFMAAQFEHYESIALLAERGNVDLKCYSRSERGEENLTSPLDWALFWKKEAAVIALLRAGASDELICRSQKGKTVFQHAAQHGLKKIVEYCIREGNADPEKLFDDVRANRVNVWEEMRDFVSSIWHALQAEKTERAVKMSMDCQTMDDQEVVAPRKVRGMSLL